MRHPITANDVTIEEVQEDVNAAMVRGYSQEVAFIPETVQMLIDEIERLRNLNHLCKCGKPSEEGVDYCTLLEEDYREEDRENRQH